MAEAIASALSEAGGGPDGRTGQTDREPCTSNPCARRRRPRGGVRGLNSPSPRRPAGFGPGTRACDDESVKSRRNARRGAPVPEGLRPPGPGAGTTPGHYAEDDVRRATLPTVEAWVSVLADKMPGLEPDVRDMAVQGAAPKLDAMLREVREVFRGAGPPDPETDPRKWNQVPEPPIWCPSNRSRKLRAASRLSGRVIGGHVCF